MRRRELDQRHEERQGPGLADSRYHIEADLSLVPTWSDAAIADDHD